jgi:protein tyrosine/serine phosphatase
MNSESKPAGKLVRWRRHVSAMLLVLTVASATYVAYTLCDANFHVIVPGQVYRSGQKNARQLTHVIQKYGIKNILNLRGENPTKGRHQTEIATAAKLNAVHYDRSLGSGTRLTLQQVNDLVTLLRQSPKPISP